MKKALSLALCLLLTAACLAACQPAEPPVHIEGTLEEILEKIYAGAGDGVTLPMALATLPLSEDMGASGGAGIAYYLGTEGIPFTEGIASESLIGSQPYSLVLLRMAEDADLEEAKALIADNVNPAKWICVAADPSEVVVDNLGDLVILIISADYEALHTSFLALAQ